MAAVDPDALLTAAELSERLGVKPATILGWHRKGRIPARRLSHKILRFDLSKVISALEAIAKPHERVAGREVVQ